MIYALLQDGALEGVKILFVPRTWSGPGSIQDINVSQTVYRKWYNNNILP